MPTKVKPVPKNRRDKIRFDMIRYGITNRSLAERLSLNEGNLSAMLNGRKERATALSLRIEEIEAAITALRKEGSE